MSLTSNSYANKFRTFKPTGMSVRQLTDQQLSDDLKILPKTSSRRTLVLREMGRRVAEDVRALTNR